MRQRKQEHNSQVPVALALLAAALLAAALVHAGRAATQPQAAGVAKPLAATAPASASQRKRGRRGKRGPRGAPGPDAGPFRQFISIDWQNGDYVGRDHQSFVAPGIGSGEVQCTPPNANEPDGVQWIRFYPDDAGTKTDPPSRWATTMWTTRIGGDLGDPANATATVVRTARLDRSNQQSGFNESMNTITVGHPERSTGSFTGMITTEPFRSATAKPPATTFELNWHWNFAGTTADGPPRCFVAATFVTKGT